ncbi:MAG: hypothetical protein KGJ86_14855 [Chloroflexota bacterium]|nr:hypothetical protein [Chloroflexota bacterium]
MSVVYKSKIAEVLRQRQMGVSELRRRLEDRGTHVSRGALDHLVSDRPVKQIDLRILWPVLDELDLDMRSAFVTATEDERPSQEQRGVATRLARQLANTRSSFRRRAISEAEQEQSEMIARLTEKVREEHPEVFDRRGRLRKRALARLLVNQLGRASLTDDDLLRMQDHAFPSADSRATP